MGTEKIVIITNLVSHKEKALYIHIPKNGGHTIYPLLSSKKWADAGRPVQISTEKMKEYYLFTFVRNPYERFFSGWKSVMKSKNQSDKITPEYFKENFSMKEIDGDKVTVDIHIGMTQTQHLGNTLVHLNKIYKFEDFLTGYNEINEKFNCGGAENPKKANVSVVVDIEKFMNNEIIDFINKKYDIDFTNFGYKKRKI